VADLFLIFARCDDKISSFLVARDAAGLSTEPINGVLGVRASMLAEVRLNACRTPKESRIDHAGFGFSHIATHALDLGRYSVAWGCVGIGQACLEASMSYASERKQFGTYLRDRQLIQRMLTDMITNVKAARLLCYQAGFLKDKKDPKAVLETSVAKYFASTMVTKVANDAVQIHGANGCGSEYPVQRYMRDARVMEIIEGSTQIQQITIPTYPY
jgi:alkylation response protein AidB-like acyl-CoA dehydrogenase